MGQYLDSCAVTNAIMNGFNFFVQHNTMVEVLGLEKADLTSLIDVMTDGELAE